MSEKRPGFDPNRLSGARPASIVQQVLSPTNVERARGFTEVRVIGVGGAGGNTVNRMIESGVRGIDFIAVNSDAQALSNSLAPRKIVIGQRLTRGLGTGGDPRLGLQAAEQDSETLTEAVADADMLFITAGMGGGTGTGAAPYIADMARSKGALTVAVVTRPFHFEGRRRQEIAAAGISELQSRVDSIILISNERLLEQSPASRQLQDAFQTADEVLNHGITGVANLITIPGLINLDFADISAVMSHGGPALMSMGTGTGDDRARAAAQAALNSPLTEGQVGGASRILLNVTGGPDMSLHEVEAIAGYCSEAAPNAGVVVGASVDPRLKGQVRLTLIATGLR